MNNIIENLQTEIITQLNPNFTYCLGLSGGVDSIVLLHIFTEIRKTHPIKFEVLHINHGISPNANSWEKFCQKICKSLNVTFNSYQAEVTKKGGESLENNARNARYQYFFKTNANVIILAHHETDQVETILSQVFRGSSLSNIGGMNKLTKKQNKVFWRPLLAIKKDEIKQYANNMQLQYIEDESNTDTKFLRNFIRHSIMPKLSQFDKNIDTKILHLGKNIRQANKLAKHLAQIDLTTTKVADNKQNKLAIDCKKFKNLDSDRQINLLSYFILQQNLPLPSSKQIEEFTRQVNNCDSDKHPKLKINNYKNLICRNKQITIKPHNQDNIVNS